MPSIRSCARTRKRARKSCSSTLSRRTSPTFTRPKMCVSVKIMHPALRCFSTICSVRRQFLNIRCVGATRRTALHFGIIARPSIMPCMTTGRPSGRWSAPGSRVMRRSSTGYELNDLTSLRNAEETMSNKHWLASYGQRIPAEINADAYRSVLEMFEQAMQRFADKPAIRCFGQTLTYADTDRLSRNFTAYLQGKLGVAKGDRIAVMLPNIPAFPIAMLGIVRAGAAQVNVNPLYTPRELEHQLNDAGVETIIIFSGSSSTLAEIIGKTGVRQIINVRPSDGIGAELPSPALDPRLTSAVAFSSALAAGAELDFKPASLAGDDLLFLQYTGGTT